MANGLSKGCGKFGVLNSNDFCVTGDTMKRACSADSLGNVAGAKMMGKLESWATQYVSKTVFNLILIGVAILVLDVWSALDVPG